MNDFDKELSRIFNELLTNVSRYDDWNAKGREMVKQAVDRYVIGEDEQMPRGVTAAEAFYIAQNNLRSEQRQALWWTK